MNSNPYIDRSIKQAKILRQLVIRMNDTDRSLETEYEEAEAKLKAKKNDPDYPSKTLEKYLEEASEEDVDDKWEPEDENEEILFLCDRILYKLMSYDANDRWFDQERYRERTQLKLKEILKKPWLGV